MFKVLEIIKIYDPINRSSTKILCLLSCENPQFGWVFSLAFGSRNKKIVRANTLSIPFLFDQLKPTLAYLRYLEVIFPNQLHPPISALKTDPLSALKPPFVCGLSKIDLLLR